MIASLAGAVAAVALDSVVLEVGGIGYRVYVSPSVIATTQAGGPLKLFTHHVVREDLQALYGFRSAEELGFFGLLLTVTGVGPKVAMAIVGSRPTAELQLAIMQQDQAVLVTIPGIGKKLAERVIFELKEKVAAAGSRLPTSPSRPARLGERHRRRAAGARLLAAGGARGGPPRPRDGGRRRLARGSRQGGAPGARPGLIRRAGPMASRWTDDPTATR